MHLFLKREKLELNPKTAEMETELENVNEIKRHGTELE